MNIMSFRADESALKAKFLELLLVRGVINRRSVVANEFQLHGAARRADLAILAGQSLIGVEIKSEFDTLARLGPQVAAYLQVFDSVMVLVARRHEAAAQALLPPSISLFVVDDSGEIREVRPALAEHALKPEARTRAIVELLPKSTLIKLIGQAEGRQSRRDLTEAACSLSEKTLRQALLSEFSQRYQQTSRGFWSLVPRRKFVSPSYLSVLSRYGTGQRALKGNWQHEQQAKWEQWASKRRAARLL